MTAEVFGRVHAALCDLPAIPKNSNAPAVMGGYKFRGIEDITAALKPLLAKHGVFIVPTIVQREDTARSTGNNKTLYVTDLLVRFDFYATDGSLFSAAVWGQGSDSGDKAVSKAITSAFKSMLSVTFCIADSESDAERHEVPESTPKSTRGSAPQDARRPAVRSTGPAGSEPPANPPVPAGGSDTPTVAVPPNRLKRAQERAAALLAANVKISDERKRAELPFLRPGIRPEEFDCWLELLDRLEDEVAQTRAAS